MRKTAIIHEIQINPSPYDYCSFVHSDRLLPGRRTVHNGSSYTYSATQPHAVTAAFGNSYGYDANGNQTGRTIGGTAYTQLFDYENRLVEVKQGSTTIGAFVYDAGGNRVVGTVSGTTTVYIAGLFEYQGGAMTSYYASAGGPVALRRTGYTSNNGIFYMLDDHLRSTGVILNQNGTISAQQYYYPFGGNRGGAFSPITTKRYTGQYHEAGLPGGEGLSYYNARWYDAELGRFVSADTLVPDPKNPQSLNRLAYVMNNTLRLTDPSGNRPSDGCEYEGCTLPISTLPKGANSNNTWVYIPYSAPKRPEYHVNESYGKKWNPLSIVRRWEYHEPDYLWIKFDIMRQVPSKSEYDALVFREAKMLAGSASRQVPLMLSAMALPMAPYAIGAAITIQVGTSIYETGRDLYYGNMGSAGQEIGFEVGGNVSDAILGYNKLPQIGGLALDFVDLILDIGSVHSIERRHMYQAANNVDQRLHDARVIEQQARQRTIQYEWLSGNSSWDWTP